MASIYTYIVNEIPAFGLTGITTGAFTALELVVSLYYTNIPRPTTMMTMDWDISFPMDGSSYLLLIKNDHGGSVAMGYVAKTVTLTKGRL
ncbi:MAG: hypothetical protein E4G94_03010 [ANME-2 cluster archaeon]|nr:MAG: hypothetical protein E4G94_03010 [ANME-2 cluster archaeon]